MGILVSLVGYCEVDAEKVGDGEVVELTLVISSFR